MILIRLGLGASENNSLSEGVDWNTMETLAMQQGLLPIMVDGIEFLPEEQRPPKELLLQWIGLTMQDEAKWLIQRKAASEMASLFHLNAIRTYVLKGDVVAECYPNSKHSVSSDMDCFLLLENGAVDAYANISMIHALWI